MIMMMMMMVMMQACLKATGSACCSKIADQGLACWVDDANTGGVL